METWATALSLRMAGVVLIADGDRDQCAGRYSGSAERPSSRSLSSLSRLRWWWVQRSTRRTTFSEPHAVAQSPRRLPSERGCVLSIEKSTSPRCGQFARFCARS